MNLFEEILNILSQYDATSAFITLTVAISMYKFYSKCIFKPSKSENLTCLPEVVTLSSFPADADESELIRATTSKDIASFIKTVFQKVNIYVLSNADDCNSVLESMQEDLHFVGLDCEWKPSENSGVALIQISLGTNCILYRMSQSSSKCEAPYQLKKLLEDKKILKFGVAIYEDVRRLFSHNIKVNGFVDLRSLAERCLPYIQAQSTEGKENKYNGMGLKSLSFKILNMRLDKSSNVQCSNWQAAELTNQQILYAAKDAIVSLEIFYALVLLRKIHQLPGGFTTLFCTSTSSNSCVKEKQNLYCYCHIEDQLVNEFNTQHKLAKPSPWFVEMACSMCQGIVDFNFKQKNNRLTNKKVSFKEKVFKHPCRAKPLYENCFLLAPDGKVLATINQNKAKWYVQKGLGYVDCEEPYTVRLSFQPRSETGLAGSEYYATIKQNVCVVCGSNESFVRKMVVPHDYRKHFPVELKGHTSHDVLLLCLQCHRSAQHADDILRQQLAAKHNAPLGTKEQIKFIDNPILIKVRSAAKALMNQKSNIPFSRKLELEATIKEYYGVATLDKELLNDTLKIGVKTTNEAFQCVHGEKVVKDIITEGCLFDFIRMWRQHFLDSMQPKYLPELWSVDHNAHKYEALTKIS